MYSLIIITLDAPNFYSGSYALHKHYQFFFSVIPYNVCVSCIYVARCLTPNVQKYESGDNERKLSAGIWIHYIQINSDLRYMEKYGFAKVRASAFEKLLNRI